MRRTLFLSAATFALAACADAPTAARSAAAGDGPRLAITTTTECQKEPGPTNTIESTSRNPAGKQPPGQQQPDQELSNRESKNCRQP
jgi:hypothetical protein